MLIWGESSKGVLMRSVEGGREGGGEGCVPSSRILSFWSRTRLLSIVESGRDNE